VPPKPSRPPAPPRRHAGSPALKRLGRSLAAARRRRGLSQTEVCALAGIGREYLSLLERGGRNPPYTTLLALARAMRTRVSLLVPG